MSQAEFRAARQISCQNRSRFFDRTQESDFAFIHLHLLEWIGPAMLEGLPPNNAAHRLRLVSDERRARAVADLIVESFEPAEAASTVFETDETLPGGAKAWLAEVYFGSAPDEAAVRALIALASDERTARAATFSLTERRDWVANSLAGLKPVRAGRFLIHGSHDRSLVKAND